MHKLSNFWKKLKFDTPIVFLLSHLKHSHGHADINGYYENKIGILMKNKSLQERFRYIYINKVWGGGHKTASGSGSRGGPTVTIKRELPLLLDSLGVKSILDIPCGDFFWMKEVSLRQKYIGADIVPEIIKHNIDLYSSPGRTFLTLDLTTDVLPKTDIILCRDCFIHLSNQNIIKAIKNIKSSGTKYLLTSTYSDVKENLDIVSGQSRLINLDLPPFSFPKAEHFIKEDNFGRSDKLLALYRLD